MPLKIGFVSDLHFSSVQPPCFHDGKLRKLSHLAGELTRGVIARMNEELRPDILVNLGDDIEDESRELDLVRYTECQDILRTAKAELVNVVGNHDTVHLTRDDLTHIWRHDGPLYYSLDRGGFHLVVLHTLESSELEVRIPHAQLEWLAADLAQTKLPVVVFMHHPASEQDVEDSYWFKGRSEVALVKERRELRTILEESKKVRAVFNGHMHWNHFDVIRGIPYVTIQSLIENVDEDAPGRPAAAYAIATLDEGHTLVRVLGNDPARYQIHV